MIRPISEVFLADNEAFGDLQDDKNINRDSKKTTPLNDRVALDELELNYHTNTIVFNGINKVVQTIMSSQIELTAHDPKVFAYFTNFINRLGAYGAKITWKELLESIFRHQVIYGRTWVENIYNKRGNSIVDWDIIDPKKMDYAKDNNGKIVLDNNGNPIGYFEILPFMDSELTERENTKKLPPRVVRPSTGKSIFFYPNQIAMIKLYTVGDGFYGIGLIEPIYKTSIRKMNIEEGLANAIYRHGFPIMWAKLGDMNHEPTPQQIQTMLTKLKDINFKQEIATPYFYDLQMMESKQTDKIKDNLEYFQDSEVSGLGVPETIATGNSDASSYASLSLQLEMFKLGLRDIVNKTFSAIEKYMFLPICQLEGFKEVPKLKWMAPEMAEEKELKIKRILEYIKLGILQPNNKAIDYIKKIEGLE